MSESTLSPSSRQPGLYGKLHSHGDFVSRRLPQEFVGPWDGWLQDGIAESRGVLGAEWEEVYREAPVWRFLLAPGVCGDQAWAGIVQPSVDRVGRYFPLTIAAALPGDIDVLATLFAAAPWYAAIEREAAVAFEGSASLDDLDARLVQLVFPPDYLAKTATSDDDTLPLGGRLFSVVKISLRTGSSFDEARAALGARQVTVGPGSCLWVNTGAPHIAPALLVTKALPAREYFCALLNGRWEEHGWEAAAGIAPPGS